jgi:hypothetical protein
MLLAALWARGGPLMLDLKVRDSMAALRNPLADRLMAALDTLGDAVVLGPAAWAHAVVAVAATLDRRGALAGRLAFGFALTGGLAALVPDQGEVLRRALARSHAWPRSPSASSRC